MGEAEALKLHVREKASHGTVEVFNDHEIAASALFLPLSLLLPPLPRFLPRLHQSEATSCQFLLRCMVVKGQQGRVQLLVLAGLAHPPLEHHTLLRTPAGLVSWGVLTPSSPLLPP